MGLKIIYNPACVDDLKYHRGNGSLYGPMLGAALVTVMQDFFSTIWDRWLLILGAVFIIFVMFFQGGVWEGIENIISYGSRSLKRAEIPE